MNEPSPAEDIFFAALEKGTPTERAAYLDEACRDAPELRRRVERLLEAHAKASGILDSPPAELQPTVDRPEADQPDSSQATAGDDLVGTHVGPYKLLEPIGEGGMGVVYMADQQAPIRRRVALKIIKPGLDTRQVIARFEAERQALALMDHPNIARVLDAGTTDAGRSYFVMELVRGVPITDYCDQNNLPVHERLELFGQVCHAVQHAHQKGIIHRDIKPSNVLVTMNDGRAVPKVIDFGVAKATNQQLTDKTLFTQFSQMVGTPLYMSPEQAEMSSLDVDTRTDIYSLGVLLYELLTGTTPFDRQLLREAAFDEIRRIIREDVPPRPSTRISTLGQKRTVVAAHRQADPQRLSQLVRGDLDWIVMKALEKDRTRRYETATGLAADVKRYLSNQPVEASPPSALYRFRKFARRNRVALTTAVLVSTALVLGTLVSTWQAIRATQAERMADEQATQAEVNAAAALAEKQRADAKTQEAEARAQEALDERERAEQRTQEANAAAAREREQKEKHRRLLYIADMNAAQRAWEESHPDRSLEILALYEPKPGENDLRGWEWHYQKRLCNSDLRTLRGHKNSVEAVACSPDGARIASGDANGAVRLWDAVSGRLLWVQDDKHSDGISSVAFSPDGSQLASAHKTGVITLWNAATGQRLRDFGGKRSVEQVSGPEHGAAFSPDSKYLACSDGERIILWVVETGERRRTLEAQIRPLGTVAFSPDGHFLASGCADNSIRLWDMETGTQTQTLAGHNGLVSAVAFNSDGTQLASASWDESIMLWDPVKGTALRTLHGHTEAVHSVAYSSDGLTIGSTSRDNTVRVWNSGSGNQERVFRGHSGWGNSVAFARNGRWLVSASNDQTVKIWDVEADQDKTHFEAGDEMLAIKIYQNASFSKQGRLSLSSYDGSVTVFNVITGQVLQTLPAHAASVNDVLFSPDDKTIATASADTSIKLWDATTGNLRRILCGHRDGVRSISIAPDGRRIASASDDNTVKIWDTETGVALRTFTGDGVNRSVCFSPDGRQLAATMGQNVVLRDAETGEVKHVLKGHNEFIYALAYEPHGHVLASASEDHTIRLWNPQDGSTIHVLRGQADGVTAVAFSIDGRRLASASDDFMIKIWDTVTGRELRTMPLSFPANRACFSPDGRYLIAVGSSGTCVFDAEWISDDARMAQFEVDRIFNRFSTGTGGAREHIHAQTDALLRTADELLRRLDQIRKGENAPQLLGESLSRQLLSREDVRQEIDRRSSWSEPMREAAVQYLNCWDDDAPALVRSRWEAQYRKHVAEARKAVDRLFDELVFTDEVIAAIETAPKDNDRLRGESLACARLRTRTTDIVYAEVWTYILGISRPRPTPAVIVGPLTSPEDFAAFAERTEASLDESGDALRLAQALCRREPQNRKFARLLALVYLRVEKPNDALQALGDVRPDDPHSLAVQLLAHLALKDGKEGSRVAKLLRVSQPWQATAEEAELTELHVLLNYKLASFFAQGKSSYGKRQWSAAAASFSMAFCLGVDDAIHLTLWGSSLQGAGRMREAGEMFTRVIGIQESLVRENPTVGDYQSGLAASYHSLANVQIAMKRKTEAAVSYQKAIDIYQKLVKEKPAAPMYQKNLAGVYYNLANLQSAGGRKSDAAMLRQKALGLQEQLARAHATEPRFRSDLADSYISLAYQQSLADYKSEALATLRKAVDLFDRLKEAAPTNTRWSQGADFARVGILMLWAFDGVGSRDEIEQITSAIRGNKLADMNRAVTLGATLFRLGRYDEAGGFLRQGLALASVVVRFQKNVGAGPRAYVAIAQLLMAMNEDRRGNPQDARDLLKKATQAVDELRKQFGEEGKFPRHKSTGIDVEALMSEAETMIDGTAADTNPGSTKEAKPQEKPDG